jgi:hypothetical protein
MTAFLRSLTPALLIGCLLSVSQTFGNAQTVAASSQKTLAPAKATITARPGAADTAKTEKKSAHPFHGKLAAIDKTANTVTIGKSVYHLTAETKIKKDGNPATLADAAVGDQASGYVKPADDGTMNASTLNIGAKLEAKHVEKKKKATNPKQ